MPEEWVDRADLIFQLVNPARTDREFERKFKATPEEWVDRADLIFQLVNPARTHHEFEHKFKATPEEWVTSRRLMHLNSKALLVAPWGRRLGTQ
jgi:hypothetical protein